MKRFKALTAGELRKCHWKQCKIEIDTWVVCEWKISVDEDWWVFVRHNNSDANWSWADDKLWYKYSRCLYLSYRDDNDSDNINYNWIEVDLEKEIKPWDLIWVSDESQKKADEDFRECALRYYIWKTKEWKFVAEDKGWYIDAWKFISSKKPKEEKKEEEKKEVTLKLTDKQLEEIKKIIN